MLLVLFIWKDKVEQEKTSAMIRESRRKLAGDVKEEEKQGARTGEIDIFNRMK